VSVKNYGAAVSGYLDPEGRSWETTVFQAGKPVLDKELQLAQDTGQEAERVRNVRATPSGWLSQDFLSCFDLATLFVPNTISNELSLAQDLPASVNGWPLLVSNTGSNTGNRVNLGAGPVGVGAKRTDLVVLEVWRRLIPASPDATGKSPAARIWRNGNVKVDAADDLTLNYADDILDGAVGSETTKRVQIQYRLRVINDVDLFSYPFGLEDPAVVANTVPATAAAPDGTPTAFTYANQEANGDPGLWRAGDGDPSNGIGTVDGYIYAIPLVGVFRRNTTAFDKNTNHNGGVIYPTGSDRPDDLWHNIIAIQDVMDLRHGISPVGWDYEEILEKNFQWLLDNDLRTDIDTTSIGGGVSGHTVLFANEIGVLPGDGVITGDTPGAEFIGEFDAARRSFSDRSIFETIVLAIPAPGGTWTPGATFTIDPTALPIFPYSAFNWASRNDAQVLWLDVLKADWIGTGLPLGCTRNALEFIQSITGLGDMPITSLTVTLRSDPLPVTLTNETLFLTLLVAYPRGLGLTKTPTDVFVRSYAINNPAQLPATTPIFYDTMETEVIDAPHREVRLQYKTLNIPSFPLSLAADLNVTGKDHFDLPERALAVYGVARNSVPITGSVTLDASGRVATFTNPADYTSPGDTLAYSYIAVRPMPQNGEQFTIYYYARAPQTVRSAVLGTSVTLTPRIVGQWIHAFTTGSGSPDEGYPWPVGFTQLGGIYPSSVGTFNGDYELASLADVSISEFSASTGYMKLPTFIGYVPEPGDMAFSRGPTDVDAEGRSYFNVSASTGYIPNAYGQNFSDAKRHRDVLPVLAEAVSTDYSHERQLVLVLLLREAMFDANNHVAFNPDLTESTTTASVFRIKGNLLNRWI
jgi:hypothetical protein